MFNSVFGDKRIENKMGNDGLYSPIANDIHNRDCSRSKRLTPSGVQLPSVLMSSCNVCYTLIGMQKLTASELLHDCIAAFLSYIVVRVIT